MERYLQLCAKDNMYVANCSTPANLFHILRRQIITTFRKPLVLFTPKSLLRHPKVISTKKDLSDGKFEPVILDNHINKNIESLVFCSGKFYYDLVDYREKNKIKDVAIVRLEQLFPLPEKEIMKIISDYNPKEIVWAQEEPRNMGAWTFVREYIEKIMTGLEMKSSRLVYCGRKEAASPATGSAARHRLEQETLVQAALTKNQQDLAAE